MKAEDVLEKAIKIAKKNGWKNPEGWERVNKIAFRPRKQREYEGNIYRYEFIEKNILFDHDFAKAFWGEGKQKHWLYDWYEIRFGLYSTDPKWKYHLAEMVKYKNPLEYIEMFFEEGNPLWPKWLQNNKTKKDNYV